MQYLGIDVSKARLDLAWLEAEQSQTAQVPNTPAGIQQLCAHLQTRTVTLIVLEATGVYHQPLVAVLLAADYPVAVLNPAQVHAYRESRLDRNKTDRQDALLLARFGQTYDRQLRRARLPSAAHARLRHWLVYRDGLVQQQTRLTNRLQAARWQDNTLLVSWLEADLEQVHSRLATVERAIADLVATLPETTIISAVTGVGPRVAAAVLGYLPPETWGNAKAAAAYAGVHPRHVQSGRSSRSHLSKRGHRRLRRYLYLAARVAVQRDAGSRACYERLLANGKAPKAALCAVMHKLLRQMMGRLRRYYAQQQPFPA